VFPDALWVARAHDRSRLGLRGWAMRVVAPVPAPTHQDGRTTLRGLVGSGDKIGLFTLPFVIVGLILNIAHGIDTGRP
jgi:hypothetical protein